MSTLALRGYLMDRGFTYEQVMEMRLDEAINLVDLDLMLEGTR